MPSSKTVPPGFLIALGDVGVDIHQVAQSAGLESLQLEALSTAEAARLLDAAFRTSGDATLGLRIGSVVKPELLGVVGLAAISAPTLGHAIARCAHYKRLFSALQVRIEEHTDGSVVRITHPQANQHSSARWQIDVELAFLTRFGTQMANPMVTPTRIDIQHPPGKISPEMYTELLGCPVQTGQSCDAIWYTSDALETPLLGASQEAHNLLVRSAEQQLETLDQDVVARVRSAIRELLPEGVATVRLVSKRLAMSERSLQRALSSEGTTFTSLLDEMRHIQAEHYLRDGRLSVIDVSYLVGFSHLNSFYRAFRRWTGVSPEAYKLQYTTLQTREA